MTDNIRYIFDKNIVLLEQYDRAIIYFREQKLDIALGIIADSMALITPSIEAIINDREYFNLTSIDSIMDMLSNILEAYKKGDYLLLADLVELQLVSFLIGVQELIISKEEMTFEEERYHENLQQIRENGIVIDMLLNEAINPQSLLKEGYRVEFTSCGLMTLAVRNGDYSFYFHTNGRVTSEAFMLAKHWYRKEIKRYIIYGLGFGYHIKELLSLSEQSEIIVYESDLNIILLACAFTELKDLFGTGRVKLVYDPDYQKLKAEIRNISKKELFCVHYPSFQNIRSDEGRKLTENHVSFRG